MKQKTFSLRNVRFLQKNTNTSLFNATKHTNYDELIDFESKMYSTSHLTSSVVLRRNIEIDLKFVKYESEMYLFAENQLYSLILEAYKHCKTTIKLVYIVRQINVHDDEHIDDESEYEEGDDVVDNECIHNIYDDLRTSLEDLLQKRTEEVESISNILKETDGCITINSVNRMNNIMESIS